MLTTFLWVECHWKRPPGISFPPWYFEAEVLQAFCPPPFRMWTRKRHNLPCPVRALDAYFHRAALWRKNEQLFVCLDLLTRGPLHLSKGWASGWSRPSHLLMSRPVNLLQWLSGPTRPEYGGLLGPYIRSCSPRGFWRSRLVLTTHISQIYSLDLDSTPGSQVLSS